MPPLLRPTPRPGCELGKQSSKLKKNTLSFLKAAHRWGFRRDVKILRLSSVVTSGVPKTMDTQKTDLNQKCANACFRENGNVAAASCRPALAASKAFDYESAFGAVRIRRCVRLPPRSIRKPPLILPLVILWVLKRILNVKDAMNL